MLRAWKQSAAAVFFCSCGLVYNNPAIAAESTGPAPTNNPPTQGGAGASVLGNAATLKEGDNALPAGQSVKVGSFGQVDLHVKDLDLSMVLQLLSIQSQRNIVASRNVAGTITADLYNVDFYEALDAVLHTNGFGYKEKGNFIYVYTQAELEAMEKAQRRMVTRIVRLNYMTATDAKRFVDPLVSERGQVTASGDITAGFQPTTGDGGGNSHADADMLVIRDYPEQVDQIAEIVKQLDVRPKQVLVEATILRARLTEQNAFGVDLSIMGDIALDNFTSPLGAIDELISGVVAPKRVGGVTTSVGNTASGLSGAKIGVVTHSVAAFVRALDQVTDTNVIANPKIMVLNRQKADMLVGQRLGYISTTSTDTTTTQSVEFLDVGTQLTLRPFISDDGYIRMELKPSLSDGETVSVGGLVIPNESTQEITTNVIVKNGQTIVLGGLFIEDTFVNRKQVPLLGDIPLLGTAFKGQDDDVIREEVIFLVTPTIVKDESLYAAGERAKESANMTILGAREGLLPWSRIKLTSSHMREAQKALDAGDREKALWATDLALGLDPTLIEARRMKEQLTGQREYNFSRSVLDDAMGNLIKEEIGETPAAPVAPTATEGKTEAAPATSDDKTEAAPAADAQSAATNASEAAAQPVNDTQAVQPEAKAAVDATADAEAQQAAKEEAAVLEAMQQWVEQAQQQTPAAAQGNAQPDDAVTQQDTPVAAAAESADTAADATVDATTDATADASVNATEDATAEFHGQVMISQDASAAVPVQDAE